MTSRKSLLCALIGFISISMVTGCATRGVRQDQTSALAASSIKETSIAAPQAQYTGLPESSAEAIHQIEQEILNADADIEKDSDAQPAPKHHKPKIPLEVNENVLKWIRFFTGPGRARFARFLKRGAQYKDLVQKILRENKVPTDLYYLAMIESGYVLSARSHARAVGAWQFILGTARLYGLKENYYIDERRDIVRATEAAAKYLSDLHLAFQSWYLAMAAYNAGAGRIMSAVIRGRSRDFWDLVEKKALPLETRNYVPKFLAAEIIGKNPEQYGFDRIDVEPVTDRVAVEIPGGMSLLTVARKSQVPFRVLKELNPNLVRNWIPRYFKTYSLWVPTDKAVQVIAARGYLENLRMKKARALAKVRSHRVYHGRYHIIRRGETLLSIAHRYRLSVYVLRRLNGLRSNRIVAGRRLLVSRVVRPSRKFHRVRRGEVLSQISARYGVSVSHLKQINDLDSSRIYPGQRLLVDEGM